jgi:hypothetical protein
MNARVTRRDPKPLLLILACLICTACGTTGSTVEEAEPVLIAEDLPIPQDPQELPASPKEMEGVEGEVPLVVAESESPANSDTDKPIEEVVVEVARERHEVILDLVSQARSLLRDVELEYFFTGKGRREVLRGRPVAFALWSESKQEWSVVHIEIPRPPI